MTRPLSGGQPGNGGGGGGPFTSSDGSIKVDGSDITVAGFGIPPNNSILVVGQAVFGTPDGGGTITINKQFLLPGGEIDLDDGVRIVAVDGGISTITGMPAVEACQINGNVAGPMISGAITLVNVTLKNTHINGSDFRIQDISFRTYHLNEVTSFGTATGQIGPVAGGIQTRALVQDGNQVGVFTETPIGGVRFFDGFYQNTPPGFIAIEIRDGTTIGAFLIFDRNSFPTTDAADRGISISDLVVVEPGAVAVTANTTTGAAGMKGRTLAVGPGLMTESDVRIVASGNTDVPDWSAIAEAIFSSAVPIVHTPSAPDITVFDVVPSENLGAADVLTMTGSARRFELVRTSSQVWYVEYLGPIDGILIDLRWAVSTVKTGSQRLTGFKWTVDRFPVTGTFDDLDGSDHTFSDLQVSTTKATTLYIASSTANQGDRFRVEVSSVSTDSQSYSKLNFAIESR